MSILAALFGWSKLPQWAIEMAVLAALAAGFALYHHRVYEHGIEAQRQADRVASAKVEAQAAAATQAAQDAANKAEEAYRDEIASDAASAAAHSFGPVRLCDDSAGSSGVPEASAPDTGDAHPGTPSSGIQPVPAGNPVLRGAGHPDIAGLLGALAGRADEMSAELREYQARRP